MIKMNKNLTFSKQIFGHTILQKTLNYRILKSNTFHLVVPVWLSMSKILARLDDHEIE
jgi:hypothetical protein